MFLSKMSGIFFDRRIIAFWCWLLVISNCVHLAVQVDRQELFKFGTHDNTLSSELEDGSSNEIQLAVPINYFSTVYRSIFVNTNGMLSFVTEIPVFYNIQFPLDYPVIAVLYSDVDTRGHGTIYWQESQAEDVRDRATDEIRRHFSSGQNFDAKSVFVVTWDSVGYYNAKNDKLNTFQVVIATDGDDTYAIIFYADKGIQWIQSDGKTQGLHDAKAQAGFMSGDGRMTTIHGSGTDHISNLDRLSNVGRGGVWMFRLGVISTGEQVGIPDLNVGTSDFSEFQTCSQGSALCHTQARCVDYSNGYCCECTNNFYGNGQNCLELGVPQRLNGKVSGVLNGIEIKDVDLHSYVVTLDGRQYTAISRIDTSIGFDMQALEPIGGVVGWVFATPRGKAKNGFQLTGGVFNRTADIEFPQTGHSVSIKQFFTGVDAFNYLRVSTEIKGTIPVIPIGTVIEMDDYVAEYNRVLPGMIRVQNKLTFKADNVETSFKVDEIITFDECQFGPREQSLDNLRLSVARNFLTYDAREQIVRYANTNKMSTREGHDPCQGHTCGQNSYCVASDEGGYRCLCTPGYESYYTQDDAQATCTDINECATGRDNCHTYSECINQLGSFTCRCLPGFSGDGVQCTKSQSCEDLNCDANAECVIAGPLRELECRCKHGYHGNGYQCVLIAQAGTEEDCNANDICDPNAVCVFHETLQRHSCQCQRGYRGDGLICVEDDDVVSCNIYNNCHPHAQCHYNALDGTYACRCNLGYEGDGFRCDATEISCSQANICSIHGKCAHNPAVGKLTCVCYDGYEGDGINCTPIDECDTPDSCGENAQCLFDNVASRFKCVCDPGFTNVGSECIAEVKFCNELNNCHKNAKCVYDAIRLQHYCKCDAGFQGDGYNCKAVATACNIFNNCDVNADCIQDPYTLAHKCQCREGFVGDGFNCILGRPCNDDADACDDNAECVRLANLNQFVCQCLPGYVGDGQTCAEAPRHEGDFLVASQGMSIVRMPLQAVRGDVGKPIVMQPLQIVIGLDVDCHAGHIYWSDVSGRTIQRSNYDGSNVEIFVSDDVESPEGVAVDWISRNLFWTDSLKDTIEVVHLDSPSRERKVLIDTDLVNPRGIAVHPARGLVFWSDWNRLSPKIESASMDGTGRITVVNTNVELPNSLTIDHEREEVCWADAGTKRIECCGLQGQNRRTVVAAITYPFGLTNNRQNFYYTDWETRKIEIVSKYGGNLEAPLQPPLGGSGKLYGLVAVPERCPRANSACSTKNGGCRHLCLPNGLGGRTCACPDYTEDEELPVCTAN